jgi:hypothetical protein
MPIIVSEGFNVVAPFVIDRRLIVDSVDSTSNSLVNLLTNYNYTNMIVWVRDEKAFYYLKDSPDELGATASDWIRFSGGGATGGCAKSGYVSGESFLGAGPSTASVVFGTPYESASYSVAITGELTSDDPTIYSVLDKTASGFIIQAEASGPLGATAMWITNCYDGSGLSSGGAGAQGPTGPGGGGSAIDLEEIAFGTGTGITSSDLFTFDNSDTSLILGFNTITRSKSSAIIGGTGNTIIGSTKDEFINSNLITSASGSCIKDSFYSSIQSSDKSIICNSIHSTIITSSIENKYGAKICNSKNATIINAPRSYIINTNGSYENISRQFIIGGYLHQMRQDEGPGPGYGYNGGSGIVGGAGNCICTGGVHSIILSGRCNLIENLNFFDPTDTSPNNQKFSGGRSAILAGERNTLSGPKIDGSVIIGGCTNSITSGTIFSTIVGGCRNTIGTSSNSTIVGGCRNTIGTSSNSTIIGGIGNFMYDSELSTMIGSSKSCIYNSCRSQILSGNYNRIYNSEDVFLIGSRITRVKGCNESITDINGFLNCFYGSKFNQTNAISLGSSLIMMTSSLRAASIVSEDSDFCSADNSLIVSSCDSTLSSTFRTSIISSCCVQISNNSDSTIISSFGSKIVGNCHNTIISSTNSSIVSYSGFGGDNHPSTSLILGGAGHCICGPKNSAIIGGVNRTLCRPGILAVGLNDGFDNVVALPSIMGCASLALGIATSSTDGIILDDNYFTLIAYPPEPSGTMDVCLPSVTSYIIGRIYVVKKNGSSTQSTVNVCPYGTNCIDGYQGYVELINPWDYYMLQADGVDNWIKLGGAVGLNL